VLPVPVLEQTQRDMLSLPGVGSSVLEISHRSSTFDDILQAAKADIKSLLGLGDNYKVLFLQGGSRLQFSMVPMNLMGETPADYILTGSWGQKARDEALREGEVNVAWDGGATNYDRLPPAEQLKLSPQASYVHLTSNETIEGVQFAEVPDCGDVPLVVDQSSDFLCRPLDVDRYGLIYACAQKNAGPAGVTIVIIRDDLLERSDDDLPGYLNYSLHAKNDSLYNTPTTFGVYMVGLVAKWLQDEIGGLKQMERLNREKSELLYQVVDDSTGFYRGHSQVDCRSLMNVTFQLSDEELLKRFLSETAAAGLANLKGHRSVGGVRASIYNAMPREGVEALASFMRDFLSRNG